MKIALLGADMESLALADAAAAAGHALVWCGDLAGADRANHEWLQTDDRGDRWEDLHDADLCDAVIVGRGAADQELRARQVQELAKQGRPLLCTFPLFDSVLTYFEVDLARGEGGGVLHHFNPLLDAGAVEQIVHWLSAGDPEFGPAEQVVATRALADRSPRQVLRHFARDVELLSRAAGPLDRIGAHAGGGESANYAALAVQLSGRRPVAVRWSVEPTTGGDALHVAVVFRNGRRQAEVAAGHGADGSLHTACGEAIARFVRDVERGGGAATWPSALAAMELADSIEISLRRGRMIDVYQRELTEHLAFKGVMSALGCGVLVAVVPLLLGIGWLLGVLNAPLSEYWPHVLLAILAAFLAIQLLPKLVLDKPRAQARSRESPTEPPAPAAVDSAD